MQELSSEVSPHPLRGEQLQAELFLSSETEQRVQCVVPPLKVSATA